MTMDRYITRGRRSLIGGGHIGALAGAKAAETTWTYIDDFLDAHAR